jgi:hypothetical protein
MILFVRRERRRFSRIAGHHAKSPKSDRDATSRSSRRSEFCSGSITFRGRRPCPSQGCVRRQVILVIPSEVEDSLDVFVREPSLFWR